MILSSRLAAPCVLLARRAFSLQPDPFAKFAEGIMRGNQKVFNRVAADIAGRGLPAGAAVLDLGASGGEPSLTIASAAKDLRVVSTDFAPPNKAIGEKRAKAFGLADRVEFHTTDAQDLSAWADGAFDAAVGTYVLMFTPDVAQVCSEVARVLKPGSPFVTAVWQPPAKVDLFGKGLMAMVGAMRESGGLPMPDPDGPPPTNPCNLADAAPDGPLGDALRAAGFADVTAEEWTYPVCVAGRDFADVAARFIEATPFYGQILGWSGNFSHGQDCGSFRIFALETFLMGKIVVPFVSSHWKLFSWARLWFLSYLRTGNFSHGQDCGSFRIFALETFLMARLWFLSYLRTDFAGAKKDGPSVHAAVRMVGPALAIAPGQAPTSTAHPAVAGDLAEFL